HSGPIWRGTILELPWATIWTASVRKRQPVSLCRRQLNRISELACPDARSPANLDSSDPKYRITSRVYTVSIVQRKRISLRRLLFVVRRNKKNGISHTTKGKTGRSCLFLRRK